MPEPGSQLAIELGVVLWVSLRGANVALAQGPIEQLIGIVHSAQDAAAWAAGRARDLAARFGGGGGGEKLTALASSGPGRVVGTCVAACVLAVGGAELAGVGQGGDHHPAQARRAHHHKEAKKSPRPQRVVVASPIPAPEPASAPASSQAPQLADVDLLGVESRTARTGSYGSRPQPATGGRRGRRSPGARTCPRNEHLLVFGIFADPDRERTVRAVGDRDAGNELLQRQVDRAATHQGGGV